MRRVAPAGSLAAAWLAGALVGSVTLTGAAIAADAPQLGPWGFDLTAMDRTVRPGEDFNRYASGAWLDRTSIPADKSIYSLRIMQSDLISSRLRELLDQGRSQADPASIDAKAGAFYAAFMDEAHIEALGSRPLKPALAEIEAARDHQALARLMGQAQMGFYASIFGVGVDVDLKNIAAYAVYLHQSGLGLPDRDYYLEPSFATQRTAYRDYIATLLSRLGRSDAPRRAAAVLDFETRIAKASWTNVEQRDPVKTYNAMTLPELRAFAPDFAWDQFLAGAGLSKAKRVVVGEKSAFPKIIAIYRATPLAVLQDWQTFSVADNAAFYLARPFANARFEFRDHRLLGQKAEQPRWQRAVRVVAGEDCQGERTYCFGNMGFGVGQMYIARYFPPQTRQKIEALVQNVKAAMRARIERLDWMGPATRAEALAKLDTYQIKVGYPDHPRDYSSLTVKADDAIGDVLRCAALDWHFQIDRLGKPVDRSNWDMTPQTNDAYNGQLRDIVFPAGFLQPPVFDPAADPAVNYGAVGAMIGHELTHGFDDEGRMLDAKGELRNWWTAQDEAEFRARAAKLGAQFSGFEPIPGVRVNGDLTMGENIADLGGLNVALEAYHRSLGGLEAPVIDGFTGDQRFFLGWAQAWRGKPSDDFLRNQVVSDPHSPRMFRVNGGVRNVDGWYAAFGASPGDRFYLAPADRVQIW
jgi:putative endopeptidase